MGFSSPIRSTRDERKDLTDIVVMFVLQFLIDIESYNFVSFSGYTQKNILTSCLLRRERDREKEREQNRHYPVSLRVTTGQLDFQGNVVRPLLVVSVNNRLQGRTY